MFEDQPSAQLSTKVDRRCSSQGLLSPSPDGPLLQVEITMPDPKDHPDAYDAKGNLVDMYKDPDMMLGFAERVRCFPDPG